MTAPTPDPEDVAVSVSFLEQRANDTGSLWGSRMPSDIRVVLDALAAVTAERDQARGQNAALTKTLHRAWGDLGAALEDARASQQMHEDARFLLDQTLAERDHLQQWLANAPHGRSCVCFAPCWQNAGGPCACWKVGL